MMDSPMKMLRHYVAAVEKVDSMLGIVRKGIKNKSANNMTSHKHT